MHAVAPYDFARLGLGDVGAGFVGEFARLGTLSEWGYSDPIRIQSLLPVCSTRAAISSSG
jgi:hypothetical protein